LSRIDKYQYESRPFGTSRATFGLINLREKTEGAEIYFLFTKYIKTRCAII